MPALPSDPRRQCSSPRCTRYIPISRNVSAKYCCEKCKQYVGQINYRKKKRQGALLVKAQDLQVVEQERIGRGGVVWKMLEETGFGNKILNDEMTQAEAAALLGVTSAAVSRSFKTFILKRDLDEEQDGWAREPHIAAMFPVAKIAELRALGMDAEGTEPFVRLLGEIAGCFWAFEHTYFTIGSRAARFIVKTFHEESIFEMILAFTFGGRTLILTPPRHGKSEMVLRFCAWIIVMFPNIQVLWVASNSDLAAQMCRKLKATFEYNDEMRLDVLGPRKKFGDKDAPKWTESEFILYTRTDHTLKSPTFTALGSTATVAGRDADFIGIDDLEERKTVQTSDLRHKSREKHAEIMERQEGHTGVVTIGSRQHIDDIPNHLMSQDEMDATWRTLVYPAHADDCPIDSEDQDAHTSCMLLPEIRSYRWLTTQRRETEALGLPGRFQLRYLQKAVPIEGIIFDIPLIKERCLDRSRGLGIPPGISGRMIAGLDPAARGTQAGFLWLWTPETTYMVDIDTYEAGGFEGAMQLMASWHERYGLDTWVYEDNSQQVEFFRDPRLAKLKDKLNLSVLKHTTGNNKHDPELGLTAMAPWYHKGIFNLPYGTDEARRKVNLLLGQLEMWTSDGYTKRGKSDIKMASWFPFPRMQRWHGSEQEVTLEMGSESSYPSYGSSVGAPWPTTQYPGG